MGHPTHRRTGYPGVSMTLVVSVLVAFGLGWLGATLAGVGTPPASVPAPAPTATAPPAVPTTTEAPVAPIGFAEPAVTAEGLEVMPVVTRLVDGVVVTLVVQNHGNTPVAVDNTSLGPHEVTFRGQTMPMEMAPVTKTLIPGEALVYAFRVHLPDMNLGELSFTVGGVPVSGQVAAD